MAVFWQSLPGRFDPLCESTTQIINAQDLPSPTGLNCNPCLGPAPISDCLDFDCCAGQCCCNCFQYDFPGVTISGGDGSPDANMNIASLNAIVNSGFSVSFISCPSGECDPSTTMCDSLCGADLVGVFPNQYQPCQFFWDSPPTNWGGNLTVAYRDGEILSVTWGIGVGAVPVSGHTDYSFSVSFGVIPTQANNLNCTGGTLSAVYGAAVWNGLTNLVVDVSGPSNGALTGVPCS